MVWASGGGWVVVCHFFDKEFIFFFWGGEYFSIK